MSLFKTMIAGATTLFMILGSSSNSSAGECGEGRVTLSILSGLGILGVGLYDIATAPVCPTLQ